MPFVKKGRPEHGGSTAEKGNLRNPRSSWTETTTDSSSLSTSLRDSSESLGFVDTQIQTASSKFAQQAAESLRESVSNSEKVKKKLEDNGFTINKLNLADKEIAGRDAEIDILLTAYKKLTEDGVSSMVSITGCSGAGKTILAKQLQPGVSRTKGFFCLGKFDQKRRGEPYTALDSAFTELAQQIQCRGDAFAGQIRSQILEAIGAGVQVLTDILPGFCRSFLTVQSQSDSTSISLDQRIAQLNFVMRKLVEIVSGPNHRLVLILDDVQWADRESSDLVQSLMGHKDSAFMLIATSRIDEMDDKNAFKTIAKQLDDQGVHTCVTVGNLESESVNQIVANTLRATVEFTKSLSDVVYSKTEGNPFFVVVFLKSLVEDELLVYNFGLMQWVWDDAVIQALPVTDNVASLLTTKLQKLPNSVRLFLEVASCLGQNMEKEVLQVALEHVSKVLGRSSGKTERFGEARDCCVALGLLEEAGSKLRFVHDQVQAAAFQQIPQEKVTTMQLEIGRCLLQDVKCEQLDRQLFLAVDLCNSFPSSMLNEAEKVKLGKYNLLAGEKAIAVSSFRSALLYLDAGLGCLDDDQENNELRLKLSIAASEACYVTGDFDKMDVHMDTVRSTPGPFDLKVRMYRTRMVAFGAQERFDEAISTGMYILDELGMVSKKSASPGLLSVIIELTKTRRMIKKYDQESLCNLPELKDEKRILAMSVIFKTATITYLARPNLFLTLYLRAVRWSLKYGVCKYSPPAIGVFAIILCGVVGDFKQARMYGEAAMFLSNRLDARETLSTTSVSVFAFTQHWTHNLRDSCKPLRYGYKVGMESGQAEIACVNIMNYDMIRYFSGCCKLDELVFDLKKHLVLLREYKQDSLNTFFALNLQVILNLMGESENPIVLTGTAMNQDEMMKTAQDTKNHLLTGVIAAFAAHVAYLYGSYDLAVSHIEKTKGFGSKYYHGSSHVPHHFFFQALSFLGAAQQGQNARKNLARGSKVIKMLKTWSQAGNVNVQHWIRLLEAELAAMKDNAAASQIYEDAIVMAGRAGYLHDRALAHARAGRFYHEVMNDRYWAAYHFDNSVQGYWEWGARGLARHIVEKYGNVLKAENQQLSDLSRDLLVAGSSKRLANSLEFKKK